MNETQLNEEAIKMSFGKEIMIYFGDMARW
jgi:hypothetical protein